MSLVISVGKTYELHEGDDRWQVEVYGLTLTHVLFRYVKDHQLVDKFGNNPRGARSFDDFEKNASPW